MSKRSLSNKPKQIIVQNIYYLLAYAFEVLHIEDYSNVELEQFQYADDLLAEILLLGIESHRRRGFERAYQELTDESWRIKGRLDMRETMRLERHRNAKVQVIYDEYTKNTLMNQILKTSTRILVGSGEVDNSRRRRLRLALTYLNDVSFIKNYRHIEWSQLKYHRNNRTYALLMNVCQLIIQRMILSRSTGDHILPVFDEEAKFYSLFEKFLLKYFQKHFPQLNPKSELITPPQSASILAPTMKTDISLTRGDKKLIIDAKCYGKILSMRFDEGFLDAAHIRQIYYYASHAGGPDDVSAYLIYAGTDSTALAERWEDNGYDLGCYTLDLSKDFKVIENCLDGIVYQTFGPISKYK